MLTAARSLRSRIASFWFVGSNDGSRFLFFARFCGLSIAYFYSYFVLKDKSCTRTHTHTDMQWLHSKMTRCCSRAIRVRVFPKCSVVKPTKHFSLFCSRLSSTRKLFVLLRVFVVVGGDVVERTHAKRMQIHAKWFECEQTPTVNSPTTKNDLRKCKEKKNKLTKLRRAALVRERVKSKWENKNSVINILRI